MTISISDIETGIINRLKARWAAAGMTERVEDFNVGLDFEDILGVPAISVSTERIGVEHITDGIFSIGPVVSIYVVFKNPASPDARRAGTYPLVMGTIGILAKQKLGLAIDPLMPAGDIVEVFHATLKAKGLVCFKIQLSTSFDMEMDGDGEEYIRLLAIGVNYKRQDPAQDDPDAADEIEIPPPEEP